MRSSISESDIASLPEMTTLSSAQRCGGMFVHPARRRRQRVAAETDWREAGDIALRRSASRTLARHATTGPHAGTNPACGDGQMGVAERIAFTLGLGIGFACSPRVVTAPEGRHAPG